MAKIFWVKIDPYDEKLVTIALESGVDAVWVADEQHEAVKKLAKIKVIGQKKGDLIVGKDLDVVKINQKSDEDKVVKYQGQIPVVIENSDWTIIPLENLISKTTNLIQSVNSPQEAKLALETMEKGADGILLQPQSLNDLKQTGEIVRQASTEKLDLKVAKIVETKAVSMSDRCCIDTTSILPPGDGLLVGDSSKAFFLIHNENVESPFCAPRPFRVNAGAVHAYIKLPNNKTKYLCEVSAGDEVITVNPQGETRIVAVGRNKIERRPMMLVKAEAAGKTISVVVQNAETIRLTSLKGKPVSVTQIKKGDEVLVYLSSGSGRHFGEEIEETITEK
jgi:3-dehydroquinate synthase II